MKILQKLRSWYWWHFTHHDTLQERFAKSMQGQPNTILYNYVCTYRPPDRDVVQPRSRHPPQGIPLQAQEEWRAQEIARHNKGTRIVYRKTQS